MTVTEPDEQRASQGESDRLGALIDRVSSLMHRYETRERLNPNSQIAGSSRVLLIELLSEVHEALPPGSIKTVVGIRVDVIKGTRAEVAEVLDAVEPRMVADELDLLDQVLRELQTKHAQEASPRDVLTDRPPAGPNPTIPHGSGGADMWRSGPSGPPSPKFHRSPEHVAGKSWADTPLWEAESIS